MFVGPADSAAPPPAEEPPRLAKGPQEKNLSFISLLLTFVYILKLCHPSGTQIGSAMNRTNQRVIQWHVPSG